MPATNRTVAFWASLILAKVSENEWEAGIWLLMAIVALIVDIKNS